MTRLYAFFLYVEYAWIYRFHVYSILLFRSIFKWRLNLQIISYIIYSHYRHYERIYWHYKRIYSAYKHMVDSDSCLLLLETFTLNLYDYNRCVKQTLLLAIHHPTWRLALLTHLIFTTKDYFLIQSHALSIEWVSTRYFFLFSKSHRSPASHVHDRIVAAQLFSGNHIYWSYIHN